ncbi:MAG TPA: T9SS type A sorting domain-containing protein [Paludibacter sp.]|nr:T9SS type A sorting domain-containing protein [Paludibacter sp.]
MKKLIILLILSFFTFIVSANWKHFYPNISQVQMLSDNLGFAVGDNGLLIKFDGVKWNRMESGINDELTCLYFFSSDEGYIGTMMGKLFHYKNGIAKLIYTTPKNLYDWNPFVRIRMYSKSLGYLLCGSQILKFDGNQCTIDYDLGYNILRLEGDISFNSENDVWYVACGGEVYRRVGSTWQRYNIGSTKDLTSIFFRNGKGYMIGPLTCFYFDGYSWNSIPGGGGKEIWAESMNNIWTISKDGNIKHFNGISWSSNFTPTDVSSKDFNSISFSNANNGWIVGERMTILSLKNNIVQVYNKMQTSNDLWDVFFINANNGWAVGDSGTILHFNGTEWTSFESPTNKSLYSVWFTSSNNGWCVGEEGCILHYNGSKWGVISSPTQKKLNSVHFSNATNGWAVGGNVTLRYNGTNWVINNDAFGGNVVFTYDANSTWVGSGSLYKYTSGSWFVNSGPSSVFGIHFFDPSMGFAVGHVTNTTNSINSWIWEFNSASGWELSLGPAQDDLYAIHCVDQNNCWTVGHEKIYKWDGIQWMTQVGLGTYLTRLYSVFMNSNTQGWIVGEKGNILYTNDGGNSVITATWDINNGIRNTELAIFPNPASKYIRIEIPKNINKIESRIFSVDGHFILESEDAEIDIQNLIPGMYIINTIGSTFSATGKFVKN